jgi:TRAP-type C4-dicarboxylate transport system substrate-binding protein
MKGRARLAFMTLVLTAAVAAVSAPSRAAEYTLKWAVVTRGDMQEKFGHKLAEVLPKATNGRVEVKVYPGGQLGNPAALIEGLQLGTVEGYENPADFFSGVDARFGAFSIPFLFRDTAHANKVLADPEFNALVLSMAEAKGLVGVNLAVAAESRFISAPRSRCAPSPTSKARSCASMRHRPSVHAWPRWVRPPYRWAYRK